MRSLNMQPIERQAKQGGPHLEVVGEPWVTIQGEGPYAGRPAVFLRLAGCTLKCPGCDTNYTEGRMPVQKEWVVEELAKLATTPGNSRRPRIVVITGGEPFRQDILPVVQDLTYKHNLHVQIETNGFTEPLGDWSVWNPSLSVVVSPKMTVELSVWRLAKFAKYVLHYDRVADDGLPSGGALGYRGSNCDRPPSGWPGTIYVQPEDTGDEGANKKNADACVRSAQQFGYLVSVQTHKILGVP